MRFRIDGALKEVLTLPAAMGVGLVSRIKIMAGMNIVERRRPQDGQLTTVDRRQGHRRPRGDRRHHLGREVRHADPRQDPLACCACSDLGMPTDTHETFSKLVRAPFGMVLCAGPTGSGKTTTLYATLTRGQPTRPATS